MAVRDVRNFSFLKRAIEQRYRFRNDPTNPNFRSFKGIQYEPQTNPNSVFGRIYSTFRELIDKKHLNLKQYLNIGEKSVLERLYLNLKKDANLKFLDDSDSIVNDQKYELSDQYYQGQSKEITALQQAEPAPVAHAGMPSAPAITRTPSQPRFIHNIPQTPVPAKTKQPNIPTEKIINPGGEPAKPEIPQNFQKAFEGEPAEVLHPNRQPVPEVFNKAFKNAPDYTLNPTQAAPQESSKQSSIKQPPFQTPKIPTSFANTAKNLTSKGGVFFQKNVGKYFTAGRVATLASTGIGAITGGALTNGNPLGIFGGGGLGALAPSWIRSGGATKLLGNVGNGAINAGVRFSNQIGNGATKFSVGSKKAIIWVFVGIILLSIIGGLFGATSGTTPSTGTVPVGTSSDISSCKFTRANVSAPFQSSLLLSYIQEAAQKSTIPPLPIWI
ncbi:hypothetical protein M1437_02845 [Patescibacteria group bacterium]|nr:hypothetical protein [Patescibacteria group bacterium]